MQDDHDRKITKIESCTGKPRNTGTFYITHCYRKYNSLLEKAFEENGGYIQGEKLDELIGRIQTLFLQNLKNWNFEIPTKKSDLKSKTDWNRWFLGDSSPF